MQTANIVLHIGGDSGTTVPKYAITASEIAVLQTIHGPGSVSEIEPSDPVERTSREEIKRLGELYGRAKTQDANGTAVSVMALLFPGAAARAFATLDELEIDPSFFKATSRATPADAPAPKAKRDDGPTLAEFVAAGYPAANYPPYGYAAKIDPDADAAAAAAAAAEAASKPKRGKKADDVADDDVADDDQEVDADGKLFD